jgi:tetratricopeptide (TPR) repeat protein
MRERGVTCRTISLMLFGLALSGQTREWVRQSAGDVVVYTRLGAKARGEVVSALGETRESLDRDLLPLARTAPPVRVLIEPSAADFARFRRAEPVRGFCTTGGEADYIVLTEGTAELLRVARHEMVHRHLARTLPALPEWLEEGLAEYYSSLRRSGVEVEAGVEIPAHRRLLLTSPWMPEKEIARNNPAGEATPDAGRTALFYAQSWAIVHHLLSWPESRTRFPQYLRQLASGQPPDDAFREAFGQTLGQTLAEMQGTLSSPAAAVRRLSGIAAPAPKDQERADEAEIQTLRADIHRLLGQREEADPIWKSLTDRGSSLDAAEAGRAGLLALMRHDYGAAGQALDRAIALQSRDPQVWFESAMLLRDRQGDGAEIERRLNRCLELAPGFAPAWEQLAKAKDRRNAPAEALGDLRQALAIDPRRFEYLEALAELSRRLGRRGEAAELARQASRAARTSAQREQAEGLLRQWEQEDGRARTAITPGRPTVRTPDSWKPAPGSTAQGNLERIDCLDSGVVFHVRVGGELRRFEASDLSAVTIAGAGPGRTFQCGPQSPALAVAVDYVPASDGVPARLLRLAVR